MKITITEIKCEVIPQFYKNGKRKSRDKIVWHEEQITFEAKPVKGHEGLFYNPNEEIRRYVYDADGNLKYGIWRYGYSGTKDHELPLHVTSKGELVSSSSFYGYDGPMGKASYAHLVKIL